MPRLADDHRQPAFASDRGFEREREVALLGLAADERPPIVGSRVAPPDWYCASTVARHIVGQVRGTVNSDYLLAAGRHGYEIPGAWSDLYLLLGIRWAQRARLDWPA